MAGLVLQNKQNGTPGRDVYIGVGFGVLFVLMIGSTFAMCIFIKRKTSTTDNVVIPVEHGNLQIYNTCKWHDRFHVGLHSVCSNKTSYY